MKELNNFYIDIYKLSNTKHEYEFAVNNAFFQDFDYGILEKGNATVKVILNKSETMLNINFNIEGYVELICDRSLEKFDYPIHADENIIFKFGDEEAELEDDIVIITRNTQRINIAQYIYEFMVVAIPMKKLHPQFQDEDENDDDDSNLKLVYSSGGGETDGDSSENDSDIDPVWRKLKNLNNNN